MLPVFMPAFQNQFCESGERIIRSPVGIFQEIEKAAWYFVVSWNNNTRTLTPEKPEKCYPRWSLPIFRGVLAFFRPIPMGEQFRQKSNDSGTGLCCHE
ncbi:MAG TPA: hypothetical protein DCZ91_25840 [Lachnospiraceae bacterium]|nr:hypothetical protein [Lachnospiraceae bacterium]